MSEWTHFLPLECHAAAQLLNNNYKIQDLMGCNVIESKILVLSDIFFFSCTL